MSGKAVVIGSGPNGLTAAAVLAREGWDVEVHEAGSTPGGAARSQELLGPGLITDLGAAAHPFGAASPVFRSLDLEAHGLTWAESTYAAAHPLTDGRAAFLHRDLATTAAGLAEDQRAWTLLHRDLVTHIDDHLANLLGPILRVPPHPIKMAAFGVRALPSAQRLTRAVFRTEEARALFTGSAVHAITAPSTPMTAAFGLLFGALAQTRGWPVAVGGTQAVVDALVSRVEADGGRIVADSAVGDLRQFDDADAVILNLTPRQVLALRGVDLPSRLRSRMNGWRYGTASHKLDLLLDGPIPWADARVGEATTVHVCGSAEEIERAEAEAARGVMPERPFVLVCQQQVADPSRARATGSAAVPHVVWTYAHVPNGGDPGASEAIVRQIERFAPGFRDRIIGSVETTPDGLEDWNSNLVGGDIAGGAMSGTQTLLRMPHRLRPGLYLASGSTSPGAGVHGMPGQWAARAAMADAEKRAER